MNVQIITPEIIKQDMSWGYFDGSSQNVRCGWGTILHLNNSHSFKLKSGLGQGSNSFVEFYSLKLLLLFALEHGCRQLQIFGDSKIIIAWFNQKSICLTHTLRNLFEEVIMLKAQFDYNYCQHIYRERNAISDKLSKEGALQNRGTWLITEQNGTDFYQYYHRPFIDISANNAVMG